MTEYEINYLLSEISVHSREITEFWLACSFAVVIAATYAPDNLDKKFYRIIGAGYLASSLIFISLRIGHTIRAYEIVGNSPFHDGQFISYSVMAMSGFALLLLKILGTAAVLYYLKNKMREIGSSNT